MKHQSVLAPLRPYIGSWLPADRKTKTGAKEILAARLDAPALAQWFRLVSLTGHNRSRHLWSWRLVPYFDDENNSSKEKLLEKAVACHLPIATWANQVVTASGLSLNSGDGHRNIDLINKTGPARYRFIELKIESNNPVYAAVELLEYGLLYWWARQHPEIHIKGREDQALFGAEHIVMEVLAPTAYYTGYDKAALVRFADLLSKAFNQLTQGQPKIEFVFAVLELSSEPASWDKATLEAALGNPRRLQC
jgi:hypothetical protein